MSAVYRAALSSILCLAIGAGTVTAQAAPPPTDSPGPSSAGSTAGAQRSAGPSVSPGTTSPAPQLPGLARTPSRSSEAAAPKAAASQAVSPKAAAADAPAVGGPGEYQYDAAGRIAGVVQNGTQAARYTYDDAGNITEVSRYPTTQLSVVSVVPAAARPGASITLHGTGFPATGAVVSFNGTAGTVTAATATALTVTVPSAVTTGTVSVTAGGSTVAGPRFTVAPDGPAITALSPAGGPAGTSVTLTGSGFALDKTNDIVTLNGVRAEVAAVTATSMSVIVPLEAQSGPMTVVTPYGSATSAGDFTIPTAGVDPATIESSRRIAAGSAPAPVPVATAGKVALVLFDAPASGRISIGLTANTFGGYVDASLVDDRGRKVASASGSTDFQLDASGLNPGATQQLVIRPPSTATGQITVTVSEPQLVTLSTTGNGATATFARAGQDLVGTLSATAGQQLSLGVSANSLTSYVYVSVIAPDGSTVVTPQYISSASPSSVRFTAERSGLYTTVVNPNLPGSGTLTLTASVATAGGALSTTDAGLTATIARPGQQAVWTFPGTAGQSANLGLTANTIGSYSYLRVLAPDGSIVLNNQYLSSAGSDSLALDALPATGTYQLVVEPGNAATGSITVTYSLQVDAGTLTTSSTSAAVTIARLGQGAKAAFAATAGVPLSLAISANTIAAASTIYVYKPDGSQLTSLYVSSTSEGVLRIVPEAAGTYTVRVRPNSPATGAYKLTLSSRLDAGALTTSAAALQATTSRPGQEIAYTFAGSAGQQLSLGLAANTFTAAIAVRLIDPAGASVTVNSYVSAGAKPALRMPAIAASGTYTVLVQPTAGGIGSLTVVLSADVTASAPLGGATATVSLARAGQFARVSITGVTAGADLSVAVTGNTVASFTDVAVFSPSGTETSDSFYLGSTETAKTFNLTATAAGTYVFVFEPDNTVTGSFSVSASTAVLASPALGGAASTVTLARAGQSARLQFTATAGANLSLALTANTLTSYSTVTLLRPDGTTTSQSLLSATTNGDYDFTALPAGDYTLLVRPSTPVTGSFSATLSSEVSGGTIAIGGAATSVVLTRAGQNVRTTFAGTSGQLLRLSYTGNSTGALVSISVYSPNGTALVTDRLLSSSATGNTTFPALTATGTHQLVFDVYQAKTTTISATLAVAPAAAAAAASPVVRAATATKTPTPATTEKVVPDRTSTPAWRPDRANLRGQDWVTRQKRPAGVANLVAAHGVTAVSGRVVTLQGTALAGVTVTADAVSGTTDAQGRFLLTGVSPTTRTVIVDGGSASRKGARYGAFRIKADIRQGRTTPLSATVWMPRLDTRHAVKISAPTTAETVLTTPEIPGLEVRIPAGSVVRDLKGKVVTELGITPIPLDRTPYPLPKNGVVPVFFTVQPGGAAVFPKGAQIVYPNYTRLPPGQTVDFLNYDPKDKGWYVYGHGTVSADARQVVPDEKTRVWTFDGAMFNTSLLPPWLTSRLRDFVDWLSGDPVDLSTGRMVDRRTDLFVDDVMPIQVSRTLWQGDTEKREFGVGQIDDYGMFLHSEQQYQEVDLYVPGGNKIHYVRTSAGTGYSDAQFEARGTASEFRNSTIKWYSPISGWQLTLSDGTRYRFPMYSRVTSILDRAGNQITLTRDGSNGPITQVTTPNGRWIKYRYDTSDRVIEVRDNSGRSVSYTYDTGGRLDTVTGVSGKVVADYDYDTSGRLTTIKDARNIVYLSNVYDTNGRIKTQTLPGPAVYGFDYTLDASGAVSETRVTQPDGVVRRVVFNSAGAATSDTQAYGTALARTTTFLRGVDQRVEAVTDPFNRTTTYGFDGAGRVSSIKVLTGTADERTTGQVSYTDFDQPQTVTDADGKLTRFSYDDKGNVETVTDPEGRQDKFTWTADGQIKTHKDPLDKLTSYTYRAGDLISVTDPTGRASRQFVDAAGRISVTTDPLGSSTVLTYNAQNEVTKVVDALGLSTSFEYDENGNLRKLTDPRLKTLLWSYDTSDRVEKETDQLGNFSTYTYDATGRPKLFTSRAGRKTTFEFDDLDRPKSVSYARTATESSATMGYDAFDRVKTIADTAAGTATFDYDVYDQPTKITQARGSVAFTYDPVGRLKTTTVPGQPATTYGYDGTGLLKTVAQGTNSVSTDYTAGGRPGKTSLPGGWSQTPAYDDAGVLTGISYAQGTTAKGAITYGHDAAGRVRTVSGAMANVQLPAARTGLVYNDANRLTAAGGAGLSYDDDGNLTNDGTTAYTWDARGGLTQVSRTGLSASFGYDPLGSRSSRTVNGTGTGFLDEGTNPAAELDAGNAVTANLLSGGTDQWFARTQAGVTDTVLTDGQGSPVALGAADGTLNARYAYDPFGAPTVSGATRGADLSYTGRQDDGTGLLYYRSRYYSPAQQRFISEDPIGVAGGTNLYAYAGNSPTNATDPSGNNPLLAGCAVGGLTGGGLDYLSQRLSGRKVDWGSVGRSTLEGCAMGMLGGALGELMASEGALGRAALMCNCFPAGTPVQTAEGSKPIEDVEVGDQVWAKDLSTGTPELRRVTGLFDKPTDELVDLDVGSTKLQVTPDHPFWVEGTGWTEAGRLEVGDRLADRRGGAGSPVRSVHRHAESTTVYNFQVEGDENYYVGDAQLLVHNCTLPPAMLRGANARTGYSVYFGERGGTNVYVGITNNLGRRAAQHGTRFDLTEITSGLTRGQARAIEQALINRNPGFLNKINSISPLRGRTYTDAVKWGEQWLTRNGY